MCRNGGYLRESGEYVDDWNAGCGVADSKSHVRFVLNVRCTLNGFVPIVYANKHDTHLPCRNGETLLSVTSTITVRVYLVDSLLISRDVRLLCMYDNAMLHRSHT